MKIFITTVHQNIIKIYHNKLPNEWSQDSFMSLMKVLEALDRPNGITSHSYNLS